MTNDLWCNTHPPNTSHHAWYTQCLDCDNPICNECAGMYEEDGGYGEGGAQVRIRAVCKPCAVDRTPGLNYWNSDREEHYHYCPDCHDFFSHTDEACWFAGLSKIGQQAVCPRHEEEV